MPNLLSHLAAPSCSRLGSHWDRKLQLFGNRWLPQTKYERQLFRRSSSAVATSREGDRSYARDCELVY
jgi:hypothetical protein